MIDNLRTMCSDKPVLLRYECNQAYFDALRGIVKGPVSSFQGKFEGIEIRVVEGKPDGFHPVYSKKYLDMEPVVCESVDRSY